MSKLSFYHLLDSKQIKESDLDKLFELAEKYRKQGHQKTFEESRARGLIMATLFFEPSTRTRLSFESAMNRLHGRLITLEQGATSSSIKKGETLYDTGRIMSNYADIIVMRHPTAGSVADLAKYAHVPVINAGDGPNQHPTQALVDIYTIFCEKKRLSNLKIGIVGDLKYGRTVHSLMGLLSRFPDNQFTLISCPSLKLDEEKRKIFEANGSKVEETTDLESAIEDLDVLYVTRIQQERFENQDEFEKVRDIYHIDEKLIKRSKPNMTMMHPLPRINEIDVAVDDLPQAKYFEQANYGVYIRMALLTLMTEK